MSPPSSTCSFWGTQLLFGNPQHPQEAELCLWHCCSTGWELGMSPFLPARPKQHCPPHPALQVLDLISSDSLNVPSEEEVYRAVLSWVKHDVDSRRQHVPRVRALGRG